MMYFTCMSSCLCCPLRWPSACCFPLVPAKARTILNANPLSPLSPVLQCYQPAQLNLLHTLANASGCVVILTGDFHFADIKVW